MKDITKNPSKRSRALYIIEAALEYFIAILVGETYLAKIASELGASDSLTGVLYSFVSLGCTFQLIATLLSGRSAVKRLVTVLHVANQLFFTFVYAIPLLDLSPGVKLAAFVTLLLLGHIVNNIVNPIKINWLMSFVTDGERGRFTANKEIVSLIGGMLFSFLMGNVVDVLSARGEMRTAFLISCVTMLLLTALHTLTVLLSQEKSVAQGEAHARVSLGQLMQNKALLSVIGVSMLWYAINGATSSFFATYRIKELGFSMTFCSVLAILYSIARCLFSGRMGRYADRHGFAKMLLICFSIQGCALAIHIFAVPQNGYVLHTAYTVLNAIAMAGINSAQINLLYDHAPPNLRTGALALSQAASGTVGFATTLAVTPLVDRIQQSGNTCFGLPLYAQQLLSAIGVLGILLLLLYLTRLIQKFQKGDTP